jgi:hypothetical protein
MQYNLTKFSIPSCSTSLEVMRKLKILIEAANTFSTLSVIVSTIEYVAAFIISLNLWSFSSICLGRSFSKCFRELSFSFQFIHIKPSAKFLPKIDSTFLSISFPFSILMSSSFASRMSKTSSFFCFCSNSYSYLAA